MRLLAILFLSTALSAAPREWRDSIRDVYLDGKLTRNAQTLVSSSPRLMAVVCGDEVLIFNPDSASVTRAPKSAFTFAADRTSATSEPEVVGERIGDLAKPDASTYLATTKQGSVVVAAHQSKAGAMTLDELWETAPVWRAIAEHYEPDGAVVERLRAIDAPVNLQVVLATWCGDSRQHVPRLLKAIERANNPNVRVELIGIGPEFVSPMHVVQGANITNVPTIIVKRGAEEVGRVVETPAGTTVESDVCDIVNGTPKPHPGRLERGALVTRGTYLLRDAKRRHAGTEMFEVYERPGGGQIVHSRIGKPDGTSIETWATIDAEKQPRFVEVTHRNGTATRTRFRRDGDAFSAHSRGSDGGIVDQTMTAPPAIVTPATITYAWARDAARAYVVPESGTGALRDEKFRVAEGAIPKYVKLEDGSERRLVVRPQ